MGARWWRRATRAGGAARALLAAAALGALLLRALPARLSSAHHLPAHAPADVAHHLADFSNQPDVTAWWVESDHSNYTTWSYSVGFSCGARCAGRARVRAHDEHARTPQHGHAARRHAVRLWRRACSALPLLPWPQLCDELEVSAVVWGSAAQGAELRQEWSTRCSTLGWLSGACARGLQARHDASLLRLQAQHDQRA
ncbi:hypothetical protein PYW07_017507 [Mythimna separata]|uniref:Uncharacterized protein n=1 Tax=Mythimna separata TaxID=271217 RepID=A0AAD7YXX0_MYTSE|nr:hypothetical protein PYW07_017507 [Mythimna separata]